VQYQDQLHVKGLVLLLLVFSWKRPRLLLLIIRVVAWTCRAWSRMLSAALFGPGVAWGACPLYCRFGFRFVLLLFAARCSHRMWHLQDASGGVLLM
jgi:hypothetical protein